MRFYFTDKHIEFLRQGYQEMRIPALTAAFNAKFGLTKTEGSIKSALRNRKISCGRKPGFAKGEIFHKYTPEQAEFIKKAYRSMTVAEVTKTFNARFDTRMSESQIRAFTKNHRLRSGRTGRFEKGHVPFNAGTKGVMQPNSGNFQKGHVPQNRRHLGSERICKKDGYVLVKVEEEDPYTEAKTRYRHKHVVLWEEHNGPVPDGMVVLIRGGDKRSFDIDDLELVSRHELLRLNNLRFGTLPEEVRPSALALARLQVKTSEAGRRKP